MISKNLLEYEDVLNTYKSRDHGIIALSKYRHWFPITASPKLAGIVADLMGDGHLQDHPKARIDYTSNSIEELERFNSEIHSLFGVRGKIRRCTTNKYGSMNLGVNCKPLGRTLIELKIPTGAKVFSSFDIPSWIKEDKDTFARFVNRLLSCEGCVDLYSNCIELKMFKSVDLINEGLNFFKEIKISLEQHFRIITTNPFLAGKPSIRKDGKKTIAIRMKIRRKDSLFLYHKYIGFDDKIKQKKLNEIIETLLN